MSLDWAMSTFYAEAMKVEFADNLGVISMRLSQLLLLILAETPLTFSIPEGQDIDLDSPDEPAEIPLTHEIYDSVVEACRNAGLTEQGARVFGDFIAELVTWLPTIYRDAINAGMLHESFSIAAFGDPTMSISLAHLPTWDALNEHLPAIQRGVAAAFEDAKLL